MTYEEKIVDRQVGRNGDLFANSIGEMETKEERYPYIRILVSIVEQAHPEWNQAPNKDEQISLLVFRMSRGAVNREEVAEIVRLRDAERGFSYIERRPEEKKPEEIESSEEISEEERPEEERTEGDQREEVEPSEDEDSEEDETEEEQPSEDQSKDEPEEEQPSEDQCKDEPEDGQPNEDQSEEEKKLDAKSQDDDPEKD
ncbi:MAG: hypothetical protein BMS9Abin05_1428 [Rhodothermia bacterium]|nr:MAG: hypothetical protein BMS9Abin05_1428 [Rhodothermia bacterium]